MSVLLNNSFSFNKDVYRLAFFLHTRPHEVYAGLEMLVIGFLISFGFVFVLWIPVCASHNDIIVFFSRHWVFWFFLAFITLYYGFAQLIYGVCLIVGLRRPFWGTIRWNLREDLTLERLSKANCSSLVFYPCIREPASLSLSIFSRVKGGWWGTSWYNAPLYYDEIPFILPTKRALTPKNLSQVPEFINFSATFFEDYFLKGHSDKTKYKYGDIFDIVEYKKVPDYALLRMNDGETEILIKTDAFNCGNWAEVKEFILDKKEEQKKGIKEEKKKKQKVEVLT